MVCCVNPISDLRRPFAVLADTLKEAVLTLFPIQQQMGEDWYRNKVTLLSIKYGKSNYRLTFSYLNNASDSEDIPQDTMMKYLEKMPYLREDTMKKPGF